jgi:hypothetical protein
MATTRTPLQPAPALRAFHSVGFDAYIVQYREGQEDLARESIARWVRNPDLAFSWTDAAVMGEQIPYQPESEDCECCETIADLEDLSKRLAYNLETAKSVIGLSFAMIAVLFYCLGRFAWFKAAEWGWM